MILISRPDRAGHLFGLKMPDEINDKYKKWNISNYPMTDIGFEYKVIPGKGDPGKRPYIVYQIRRI